MIALWYDFCNEIVQNDFNSVPTQSAFCRWLSQHYEDTDRKTIYNSLNKYFPSIKKEFEQLQSDVIMQGGMMGKYNTTMSIFGSKNWCGWSDTGKRTDEKEKEENAKIDRLIEAIKGVE